MERSELGAVLLDFLPRYGARIRARRRCSESQENLPKPFRTLEGRRPGSPGPHPSKERLCGITLTSTADSLAWLNVTVAVVRQNSLGSGPDVNFTYLASFLPGSHRISSNGMFWIA